MDKESLQLAGELFARAIELSSDTFSVDICHYGSFSRGKLSIKCHPFGKEQTLYYDIKCRIWEKDSMVQALETLNNHYYNREKARQELLDAEESEQRKEYEKLKAKFGA